MTAALANTWVAEAEVLGDGEGAQPLTALNNLEKALQIYRKIPQRFRDQLGVTELLIRLPQRIFGRNSIGSMTEGLKVDADGSLTLVMQKERPTDTANWLPAPDGEFNLTMRFYGPASSVLDGTYRLPAVERIN